MSGIAQGGVIFRVDGELFFLPASIAIKLLPVPEMAPVPGGPIELRGVALVDGDMIPVVDVGGEAMLSDRPSNVRAREIRSSPRGAMLVCVVLGEHVGFVGLDVVATGRFEVDPTTRVGELRYGDEVVRPFDVAGIIARLREGRWAV
jgi:chemotaxis signal transduction protein